jgi:hypothetical protein
LGARCGLKSWLFFRDLLSRVVAGSPGFCEVRIGEGSREGLGDVAADAEVEGSGVVCALFNGSDGEVDRRELLPRREPEPSRSSDTCRAGSLLVSPSGKSGSPEDVIVMVIQSQ